MLNKNSQKTCRLCQCANRLSLHKNKGQAETEGADGTGITGAVTGIRRLGAVFVRDGQPVSGGAAGSGQAAARPAGAVHRKPGGGAADRGGGHGGAAKQLGGHGHGHCLSGGGAAAAAAGGAGGVRGEYRYNGHSTAASVSGGRLAVSAAVLRGAALSGLQKLAGPLRGRGGSALGCCSRASR